MSRHDCVDGCDGTHVHKWEVTPHPYSSDFDALVTDDDQDALKALQEAAEQAWDQCADGMTRTITIKRARMETPPEYTNEANTCVSAGCKNVIPPGAYLCEVHQS